MGKSYPFHINKNNIVHIFGILSQLDNADNEYAFINEQNDFDSFMSN